MSLPATVPAASAEYNSNLAAARASGIASNAFPTRDNQGILPLSLPPEGFFPLFKSLKSAACKHAKLAGWCIVIGKGSEMRKGRQIKYLVCKHACGHDDRGPNEKDRQRDRQSKKTNCLVRMKVNERPDGSWELRWLEGRQEHNHTANDAASYHEHRRLTELRLNGA
jgi:FAR1 DNA-binding domain